MRHSRPRGVVFTPAMPHLESFLSRHVLPEHPLRNHPMWLSEHDLSRLPNWKFDLNGVQHVGKAGEAQNAPMLLAQVPVSIFLFNMDQLLPESEVHWQLPLATAPASVLTMQAYGAQTQRQLERCRRIAGFESNWWGTRRQWQEKQGLIRPGAYPAAVLGYVMTRLLHISMISDAAELLKRSFVSGKTGNLQCARDARDWSPEGVKFMGLVSDHCGKHGFQSPLYFSGGALLAAGIAVRPDADPLDVSSLEEYTPSEARAAGAASVDAKAYKQYYHLSQVILPEGYRIPENVLEAERVSPGAPVDGMTGRLLSFPELQSEAILNSPSPELASFLVRDEETELACSFLDLESPHTVHGRSLWYSPHELLEAGGLVDVNAVPVEVRVAAGSKRRARLLYNVEQLLLPVEGYKAVGRIACMRQFAGTDPPPSADENADAVAGAGNRTYSS
ncbi:uncharacterized protein Tco025E_05868 [Trypanosoma conorhini]|uniref:N-terminal domain-containing protein n=1 Tax=Trypanosoma conorhini TaxID=83891 RepID=A0A422P9I6_9TRYP|nr:uncharacterized protein Tco025E_05868 [Trypanosoma conorhini]RNF14389.1 hypothetical protein Tco025E_05868 [Trypanosoma conorhini]